MTKSNPKISEKDTEELIAIANGIGEIWSEEIVIQAKKELKKRGIDKAFQNNYLNKWSEIDKNIGIEIYKLRELNALVGYTSTEMFLIFLIAPISLFSNISFLESFAELKSENLLRKYKQKRWLILSGIIFYALFIFIMSKIS